MYRFRFILPGLLRIPSGSHRVMYSYANELVKRGHSVTISFPLVDKFSLFMGVKDYIKLFTSIIRKKRPNHFKLSPEIEIIKHLDYTRLNLDEADYWILSNWNVVKHFSHLNNISTQSDRIVQFIHHYEGYSGHNIQSVNQALDNDFKKVAVSKWTYQDHLKREIRNIHHIPNGLDHNVFRFIPEIVRNPKSVMCFYVEKEIKNYEFMVSILSNLSRMDNSIQIRLVGNTRQRPNLNFDFEYYTGLTDCDLAELYNSTGVFVNTSIVEGFSFPQLEAMACGCLVVTSDCGGNRDFVQHGTTAFVVESIEIYEWIEVILNAVNMDFHHIASNARNKANKFSWKNSVDLFERHILDLY